MKTTYYIPALLAGMLSLVGCKDNEPEGGNTPANPQDAINFSIGQESPNSRTQYSEKDWLQIEWLDGSIEGTTADEITIFCDQTLGNNKIPKKSAEYKVTKVIPYEHDVELSGGGTQKITTYNKASIGIKSGNVTDGLYWQGANVKHTFYAGYGKGIAIDPSTSTATCIYDTDQELTLDEKTNTWINMSQAYMVAFKKDVTPEDGIVDLSFRPIMTTVEVDVKGPLTDEVTIQALEVVIPETQDVIYGDGINFYFDYKITDEKTGSAIPDAQTPTAEKIIFRLREPQTVKTGETIKITAILPPILINNTNTATISIYAYQGSSSKLFTPDKPIIAGAKAVIKTDEWKKSETTQKPVDLGLSVQWASMNLGATKPEEYGDYYGWGCLLPYASSAYVNWTQYFHRLGGTNRNYQSTDCGTSTDPLRNYVNNQISIAGTEWDAATYRLGGKWRMPTLAEIKELYDNCTHEWVYANDDKKEVIGIKFTTKDQSQSIYIPSPGGLIGNSIYAPTWLGYYWSANPFNNQRAQCLQLILYTDTPTFDTNYHTSRFMGFPIRPVYDDRDNSGTADINDHGSSGEHEVSWDE